MTTDRVAGQVDCTIASPRGVLDALLELSKSRLSALVLCTTAVGFVVASGTHLDWGGLVITLVGTLLAAFGANALNQIIEVERDSRMERTRRRPLVTGALSRRSAWSFALTCAVVGPALLLMAINTLTGLLAAACVILYVLAYTPLKPLTPTNTLVGAVVGAIPPVMGWTAVTGTPDWGACVLAAILFVWQIPHFLALAWLYREDYARGGFRMLSVVDRSGGRTARVVLYYCCLLIPFTLLLSLGGITGWRYGFGAFVLGVALLVLGAQLAIELTDRRARRLFLASVIYLPLLLLLIVIDRRPNPTLTTKRQPPTAAARVAPPAVAASLAMATEASR